MRNKIITLVCLLICCTLLQACKGININGVTWFSSFPSPPRPSTSGFEAAIDSWHGAPIEELIASWGEPTRLASRGDEEYEYIYTRG